MDLLQVDFALVEKIEDSTQTNKKPTKRKK